MPTPRIHIIDVPTPDRWDDESEGARLLRQYTDVRNAVMAHEWGGDTSHAYSYQEAWANWRSQAAEVATLRTLALIDGAPVGRGFAERGLLEATTIAGVDAMVLPEFRRRGVATAIIDDLMTRMRDQGATTFQAWVDHHPAPGPRLSPPTGFGEIPAESPQVALLHRFGFELEQIERMSELRVRAAMAGLAQIRDNAAAHTGGYRLELWQGPTPEKRLAGLAALHARMSTDAPSAGLDHEPEVWDAERLRRYETSQFDGDRTLLRAIAVDETTDAPVAFTTLTSSSAPGVWYQHDTLVHAEHRGHRLGMAVKAANLEALASFDGDAVVRTWNAEENRPMLAVNEALGFVAICSEGAWQLREGS